MTNNLVRHFGSFGQTRPVAASSRLPIGNSAIGRAYQLNDVLTYAPLILTMVDEAKNQAAMS